MSIDHDTASESLREIERVQRRTREALIYGGASTSLLIWGVLVACGYVLSHLRLDYGGRIWIAILAVGTIATVVIHNMRHRTQFRALDRRITYALLILVAFGSYWATLIGPGRGREMAAFWPTLFMFGYVIAGFWLGRFFTVCGVLVTALTIAGYLWLGEWFSLWMAAINGGGLIGGALWLRRMGSTP